MSSSEENIEVLGKENHQSTSITELTTKEQRFVHLYMTGQYTLQKLASLLEVHPNTLGNWLKKPTIQAVIKETQELTHDMIAVRLKGLAFKATDTVEKMMSSPIDGVALQAAKDILDRTGHKAKQEMKIEKTVTTVEQQLKELINKTVVDAEYEVMEDEE